MEYFMYCFNLILKNVLCINYEKLGKKKNRHLCVSKSVLAVVDVQGGQQLLRCFPAVHKLVIWDGVWVQDAVAD